MVLCQPAGTPLPPAFSRSLSPPWTSRPPPSGPHHWPSQREVFSSWSNFFPGAGGLQVLLLFSRRLSRLFKSFPKPLACSAIQSGQGFLKLGHTHAFSLLAKFVVVFDSAVKGTWSAAGSSTSCSACLEAGSLMEAPGLFMARLTQVF